MVADAKKLRLIPGTSSSPTVSLSRFRLPHVTGAVTEFVESSTRSGDLVLELACTGGGTLVEALAADRRILALNPNPVALLWAHLDVTPVPLDQVQAALTQLGDMPKGDQPLISYIRRRYASRCPLCHREGIAEWFAWDRDLGQPFAKRVRCPSCHTVHEGPVDDQDLAHADAFPSTGGPAYHVALGRIAAPGDPLRPRAEKLIQLYTSRNLGILMDLMNRLPRLNAPLDVGRVITGLLVDAFDRGSSLVPYQHPNQHPRSLHVPARFVERNIWVVLEEALARYADAEIERPGPSATSLSHLLVGPDPRYLLLTRPVGELDEPALHGAVNALVLQVQPPDATFWTLSSLWATWLWGKEAPAALRTRLSRRRYDWAWYDRSLSTALQQVKPLLHPEATILLTTLSQGHGAVRAMVQAAQAAGLKRHQWIAALPNGYRLVYAPSDKPEVTTPTASATEEEMAACYQRVLQDRYEPTHRQMVTAACVIEMGAMELAEIEIEEHPEFVEVGKGRIWLASPGTSIQRPLADQVERKVMKLVQREERWSRNDLIGAVYNAFPGRLSPEPDLVQACIDAYTRSWSGGALVRRPEVEPRQRQAQVQELRDRLRALGRSLGFDVSRRLRGDIVWRDQGRRAYLFRCTTTAYLGPHLLKAPPPSDGPRCLVLPDSRAPLAALKLARDPRLQRLADEHRWVFLKTWQLERMMQEVEDRAEIGAYLGLEPSPEEETTQMALPLE